MFNRFLLKFISYFVFYFSMFGVILPDLLSAKSALSVFIGIIFSIFTLWFSVSLFVPDVKSFINYLKKSSKNAKKRSLK